MEDKAVTPRLMCGAVLRQKFTIDKSTIVESIDISFGTYKRNVTSLMRLFVVDSANTVMFNTTITAYNDNIYTNIVGGFFLAAGTYVLVLTSNVQDTFNAVSVWHKKTEGCSVMFNDKLYKDVSLDFILNTKEKCDINENVAIIENTQVRKRGRPKKV